MEPVRLENRSACEVEHQNEKQKVRLDEWNTLQSKMPRLPRQLGKYL